MLLIKQIDYYNLIIKIYKMADYDKEETVQIATLVIKELLSYGFDKYYKYKILADLNLTEDEYSQHENTDRLNPCKKTLVKAMVIEVVINGYYK